MKIGRRYHVVSCLLLASVPLQVHAQSSPADSNDEPPDLEARSLERDLVIYPAIFFAKFQPVTAEDMVRQVPGFQLDSEDDDIRGFANVAGNVLIDDRRPVTKRDSVSDILSRIPASIVARIELIRGQVRSIDLRGQSSVVNIVLREGMPAAVRWQTSLRKTTGHGPIAGGGSVSLTDSWRGIDFNTGLNGRRTSIGRKGTEVIFDGFDNVEETRFDTRGNRNVSVNANMNAAASIRETFVQLNANLRYEKRRTFTDSQRIVSMTGDQESVFFDDIEKQPAYELGIDLERSLSPDLLGKGIFLLATANDDFTDTQTDTDGAGNRTLLRESRGELDTRERIARLEFDWTGSADHLIQGNAELAYNVLDSVLIQTDDTGSGPVGVEVPGANAKVAETRWDFLLKDTWAIGALELDYGLGAEASTLTQTGDAALERDFFFVKPQVAVTYSAVASSQTRIRLAREVAQLNLEYFVSATEFLDNDVALGNPNIRPEATWRLELSQEQRLGVDGVVAVKLFHDWIADVLDLLPLTTSNEAPGNIGDGRRWGVQLEGTLPLDSVGLASAKLDVKLRWQDSTVVDPVTGLDRMLSVTSSAQGPVEFDVDNRYAYTLDYRQDFQAQNMAWGWSIAERAEQLRFKVNELEIYDEGMEFRVFVETTRWLGIKIRLDAENLLDFADTRERTLFVGERDLSPLDSRIYRDRTRGRRVELTFSGGF